MTNLLAAALAFLLVHLLVSGTRLRDVLVGRIGANIYMSLFSVASVALLIWLGFAYPGGRGSPAEAVYWSATPVTKSIQLGLQFVAVMFFVIGLTTRNPTSVAQEASMDSPETVRGMLRITRHPFLWGVAIWAAGHLLVNGDLASLIFFGSFLVLCLAGTRSIDAKRRRVFGERWRGFADRTSNVPFAAILTRGQTLAPALGEIGWWRPALAVAIYIALIFGHPYAFGVSALPNG